MPHFGELHNIKVSHFWQQEVEYLNYPNEFHLNLVSRMWWAMWSSATRLVDIWLKVWGISTSAGWQQVAYTCSGGCEGLHREYFAGTNLYHEPIRVVEEHLLNGDAGFVDGFPGVLDTVLLQCLFYPCNGVTLQTMTGKNISQTSLKSPMRSKNQ